MKGDRLFRPVGFFDFTSEGDSPDDVIQKSVIPCVACLALYHNWEREAMVVVYAVLSLTPISLDIGNL
jgi:hypothetical protein